VKATLSVAIAAIIAVGIGAVFIGHATDLVACDGTKSASKTAQAHVDAALAAMPADAHGCCKSAVATAVTAGYNACVAGTTTKTAGTTSSCCADKTAAVTTADTGAWVTFSLASLGEDAHGCCTDAAKTALVSLAANCSQNASASSCSEYSAAGTKTASSCSEYSAAGTKTASSCTKSDKVSLTYAEVDLREGRRLVLTGNAVCTKCNFKTTESCSTLFQTADGKVYRLIENNMIKGLRAADEDVQITTTIRKVDGVKYLEVETFKAI